MQSEKQDDRLTEIEQVLSQLTKGLEVQELLEVLDGVAQANSVDPDYFQRWTRIRHHDGLIATEIVHANVVRSLQARFRRGEKVVVGDRTWAADGEDEAMRDEGA